MYVPKVKPRRAQGQLRRRPFRFYPPDLARHVLERSQSIFPLYLPDLGTQWEGRGRGLGGWGVAKSFACLHAVTSGGGGWLTSPKNKNETRNLLSYNPAGTKKNLRQKERHTKTKNTHKTRKQTKQKKTGTKKYTGIYIYIYIYQVYTYSKYIKIAAALPKKRPYAYILTYLHGQLGADGLVV